MWKKVSCFAVTLILTLTSPTVRDAGEDCLLRQHIIQSGQAEDDGNQNQNNIMFICCFFPPER